MRGFALLPLGMVLLVSACAEPGPGACASANRGVNLGTLIQNSVTGSYDACLTSMSAELVTLRLEASNLRSQASALNAQAARLDGERRAAAQRLASLNAEQARLLDLISAAENSASAQEAQAAVSEANAINSQIDALNRGGVASSAQAAEIRARQNRLNRLATIMTH